MWSLASAMASFMWLVAPAVTVALHVSTRVRPSISVLSGAPLARSLLTYRSGRELGAVPNGLPLLMVLIDTGSAPTFAQFTPLTKNANVSLNWVLTNSLYSSEAKTYWNDTLAAFATKSNWSTDASNVGNPDRAVRSGSPPRPLSHEMLSDWFGPTTLLRQPELRMMPDSKPTIPVTPVKRPAACGTPEYVTFDTVTPVPTSVAARSAGVRPLVRSI